MYDILLQIMNFIIVWFYFMLGCCCFYLLVRLATFAILCSRQQFFDWQQRKDKHKKKLNERRLYE